MDDKAQRGVGMLAAAIGLGVLADALLRNVPWGINLPVFMTALVAILVVLAWFFKLPLAGEGRWMLAAALGFAAAIAWRDSTTLKTANFLAVLLASALALVRGRSGQIWSLSIVQGIVSAAITAMNVCFGLALLIIGEIPWKSSNTDPRRRRAASIVRGILLAVPLLLIFGGLFAAADAAFANLVTRMFQWDPEVVLMHFLVITAGTWVAGGYLRGTLLRDDETIIEPGTRLFTLGSVEMSVALGSLNALFLLFVYVQLPYLFGGQAHVIATAGLTAADYARRGFFELVTVAGLVLPLLLCIQVHLPEGSGQGQRLFRWLAGALILLTLIVMASAVQRMALYYVGFGLTELRFYTTAFMGLLALMFLGYAATALRGRRGFFFSAVVCCFTVLAGLDIVSPDALIVRANVARLARHRGFDPAYANELSADAVPSLIDALPRLSEGERRTVSQVMSSRWIQSNPGDWRVWSVSRAEARAEARRSASAIRAYSLDGAPGTASGAP